MSVENAVKFLVRCRDDQPFLAEIVALWTKAINKVGCQVLDEAKRQGYEFTAEELQKAMSPEQLSGIIQIGFTYLSGGIPRAGSITLSGITQIGFTYLSAISPIFIRPEPETSPELIIRG